MLALSSSSSSSSSLVVVVWAAVMVCLLCMAGTVSSASARSVPAIEGVRITLNADAKALATPASAKTLPKLNAVRAAAKKIGPLPVVGSTSSQPAAIQAERALKTLHGIKKSISDIHSEIDMLGQKAVPYYPEPKKPVFKTDPFLGQTKAKLEKDRKKLAAAKEKGRKKKRFYKELDHKKQLQEKSKKIDDNLLKVRRHENGIKAKERNVKMDRLTKRRAALKQAALKEKMAKVKENAHKVNKERAGKKFLRERTNKRNTLEMAKKRKYARQQAARFEKQSKSLAKKKVNLQKAENKSKEAKVKATAKYESAVKKGVLERKEKKVRRAANRKAAAAERRAKSSEYKLKMTKIGESTQKAKAKHSEHAVKKLKLKKEHLVKTRGIERAKKSAEKKSKASAKRIGERAYKNGRFKAKQKERLAKMKALAAERKVKLSNRKLSEKNRKEKRAKKHTSEKGSKRLAAAHAKERQQKSKKVLERGRKSRERKTKLEKKRKRLAAAQLKVCLRKKRLYYNKMHKVVLKCKRLSSSRRNACYASLQRNMKTWYAGVRASCKHRGHWACLRAKKYFHSFMHRRLSACKKKKAGTARKSCLAILNQNKTAWYGSVIYSCMTASQRAKESRTKERVAKKHLTSKNQREKASKKATQERTYKRLNREKSRKAKRSEKRIKQKERHTKALIALRLAAAMRHKNERKIKLLQARERQAKAKAIRAKERRLKALRSRKRARERRIKERAAKKRLSKIQREKASKKAIQERTSKRLNREKSRKAKRSERLIKQKERHAKALIVVRLAAAMRHKNERKTKLLKVRERQAKTKAIRAKERRLKALRLRQCLVQKKRYLRRVNAAANKCLRKVGAAREYCLKVLAAARGAWFTSVAAYCTHKGRHTCVVAKKSYYTKVHAAGSICKSTTAGTNRARCLLSLKVKSAGWYRTVAYACTAHKHAEKIIKASKKERHTKAMERHTKAVARQRKAAARARHEKKIKAALAKRLERAQKAAKARHTRNAERALKKALRLEKSGKRIAAAKAEKKGKASRNRCVRAKNGYYTRVHNYAVSCSSQRTHSTRQTCYKRLQSNMKVWFVPVRAACHKRGHWKCLRAKLAFHHKVSPRLATCATKSGTARKSCLAKLTRDKRSWYPAVRRACPVAKHRTIQACRVAKAAYYKRVHVYGNSCTSRPTHAARKSCLKNLIKKQKHWYLSVSAVCTKKATHSCRKAKNAYFARIQNAIRRCKNNKACINRMRRNRTAWFKSVKRVCK